MPHGFPEEQLYAAGPLEALWSELSTAKWVAGTGLPLAVTLISIAIAFLLVRAQIRHDRDLIDEQRDASLAGQLGWALREVAEYSDEIDTDAATTTERSWHPARPVFDATRQASVAGLSDPNGAMKLAQDLGRDMFWRWRTAQRHVADAPSEEVRQERANYLVTVVHTPQQLLLKLSERIIQWNGHGALPTLTATELGSWTPVPLPATGETQAAHQQWVADLRSEIEFEIARIATQRAEAAARRAAHNS